MEKEQLITEPQISSEGYGEINPLFAPRPVLKARIENGRFVPEGHTAEQEQDSTKTQVANALDDQGDNTPKAQKNGLPATNNDSSPSTDTQKGGCSTSWALGLDSPPTGKLLLSVIQLPFSDT